MSLYELESMMRALPQLDPKKAAEPTDEEWAEGEALLVAAVTNLPDVRL